MKNLNLNLPYRTVKDDERKVLRTNAHVTEHTLRVLVQIRYSQGMNGTDSDMWGDIMDLMNEITQSDEETSTSIEIEKSALLWLLSVVNWCRDNSKVPAQLASWTRTLLDALEEAKKLGEPKLEVVRKND